MSTDLIDNLQIITPSHDDCWNRIGVRGDSSCRELSRHVHCRNCPVFAASSQALFVRDTPSDYLAEWTDRLSHVEEPPKGDTFPVVIFRLGREWFAWDARSVVEVTDPKCIRRLPYRSNRVLLGLVNIRGELFLCMSLRELLSIPSGSDRDDSDDQRTRRLLVVSQGTSRWALPVDEVLGVSRLPQRDVSNVPITVSHSSDKFARGVFDADGRSMGLLAEDEIFAALEGRLR